MGRGEASVGLSILRNAQPGRREGEHEGEREGEREDEGLNLNVKVSEGEGEVEGEGEGEDEVWLIRWTQIQEATHRQ